LETALSGQKKKAQPTKKRKRTKGVKKVMSQMQRTHKKKAEKTMVLPSETRAARVQV